MTARLDSICAGSRNPCCKVPMAASMIAMRRGRSPWVAGRIERTVDDSIEDGNERLLRLGGNG